MDLTHVPAQLNSLSPTPDAMTIVALERQKVHEKIVRLRALREAAEMEKTATDTKRKK